jgi:hypothetical protein
VLDPGTGDFSLRLLQDVCQDGLRPAQLVVSGTEMIKGLGAAARPQPP